MRVYGNMDFSGGGISNFNFDEQADFPVSPTVGRTILRQGRMMTCVLIDNGLPVWQLLGAQRTRAVYTQSTPTSRWTFHHGLNTGIPVVQVYDSLGELMIPSKIEIISVNEIDIYFPTTMSGAAVVLGGADHGIAAPNIAYEEDVTVAASSWVIVHGLGYEPQVDVYIDGYIVQPQSIVHDSTVQTTITFADTRTGTVVMY